ncbi:MAG: hypothetical protein O7B81_00425 [Gammaproteobacteria bacterium]|nr:hypothetical protein [Gammaproteobacteria bacterium]
MQYDTFSSFRSKVSAELMAATKARDKLTVGALRVALGAIDNASAVRRTESHLPVSGRSGEVTGRRVGRRDIERVILSEAQERAAAGIEYSRLGQTERADHLKAEATIIRACLKHLRVDDDSNPPEAG